jgi:glucose/arabinose dehydrogenase
MSRYNPAEEPMRPPQISGFAVASLALACGAAAQVRLAAQLTNFPQNDGTVVAQPPGVDRYLYCALRSGTVRALRDGSLLATPVVSVTTYVGSEGGLLGMAFHPQFQQNGFLYVLYTTAAAPQGTRIERYTLDPANPEVAIGGSAFTILTIDRSPSTNHQAGWIGFGPDGFLYISSGNGGLGSNSQPLTTMLGKLLRIDVDHDDFPSDPQKNYAIPPTNPFFGSTNALPEIWAYGLRNPYRCSFDRQTGDLWIGDVGDSAEEEIDFQPSLGLPPYPARNYGYPCLEGSRCADSAPGCGCYTGDSVLPIFEYGRTYGIANVGGYVYRGSAIPALRGTFFLGDLIGSVYTFRKTPDAITEFQKRTDLGTLPPNGFFGFGEDQSGELYLCAASGFYKIVPQCAPNCDGSTTPPILNVSDFNCFLAAFAAGDPYANCDGSTAAPVLNVADFVCFLQQFAGGCP